MKKNSNLKKRTKKQQNGGSHDQLITLTRETRPDYRVYKIHEIVPARVIVRLKYEYNRTLTNVGFNTASTQLNANGAFDVDPSLGSPSLTGFAAWATFYDKYRVLKVKSTATFGNREVFPVMANMGFENNFYTANTKGVSRFGNDNQITKLLPAVSGGNCPTMTITRSAPEVVGDASVMTDLNYTGSGGSNPLTLWYVSTAVSAEPLGAVFAVGVVVRWELFFDVEFFNRNGLLA